MRDYIIRYFPPPGAQARAGRLRACGRAGAAVHPTAWQSTSLRLRPRGSIAAAPRRVLLSPARRSAASSAELGSRGPQFALRGGGQAAGAEMVHRHAEKYSRVRRARARACRVAPRSPPGARALRRRRWTRRCWPTCRAWARRRTSPHSRATRSEAAVGDIPCLLNTCTKCSMHVRAPLSIFATQVHECKPIQLWTHPPRTDPTLDTPVARARARRMHLRP